MAVPSPRPASRWQRVPGALVRRTHGRVIVLPLAAHDAVALTGAAAAVYLSLDDPRSDRELLEDLRDLGADADGLAETLELLRDSALVEPVCAAP